MIINASTGTRSRSVFFTPLFVFRHRIGRLRVKIPVPFGQDIFIFSKCWCVELLVLPLSVLTVRREFDGVLRHPAFWSFL